MERPPRLERCPYDATPIVADAYPGGFVVVSCPACNAAWEVHNLLVLRVRDPNWQALEATRAAR